MLILLLAQMDYAADDTPRRLFCIRFAGFSPCCFATTGRHAISISFLLSYFAFDAVIAADALPLAA